jgi:hydroxymethylpyrimidine/phosphomethylpyrimidine kinase
VTFEYQRLLLKYHGSGCTLSSSIAAFIALGMTTEGAVAEAQDFTWQTLRYGLKNGRGQLIPNRFYWMTNDPEEDNEPKHH